MRDEIIQLTVLDIGDASIKQYSGKDGPYYSSFYYPANEMPRSSFYDSNIYSGKITLRTIILPAKVTSIGIRAFCSCNSLTGSLIIPISVTSIGSDAFYYCDHITGSLTHPNSVTSIGFEAFSNCSGTKRESDLSQFGYFHWK